MRTVCLLTSISALALAAGTTAHAQVSLGTVVDLSLRNSPKVQMAKADLAKAQAVLSESKDAFIPRVTTDGGYGKSTGAPLGLPTIFSITGQSLVFSFSQPDYIRAARASVQATQHALFEAEIEVSEDASNTYIALDNALERQKVVKDEQDIAGRLVEVVNDRVNAGVDAHIEWVKARRTKVQLELQSLVIDDEINLDVTHLSQLTGLPKTGIAAVHSTIPKLTRPVPVRQGSDTVADSEGIKAAFAVADAKQHTAFGDRRYLFRPQIVLQANYSRVATSLSSYLAYYPRFAGTPDNPNSQNALGFGLVITVPLLDMAHHAKAHQSAADAARALAEANQQRSTFLEGRAKLRNATLELNKRAELAELDHEYAEDQLETLRIQTQAGASNLSGPQVTPKDELNAHLQERQKSYDLLSAELQLHQTQVNLLRQQGGLADWIHATIGTSSGTPSIPIAGPQTNTPAVPGAPPTSAIPGAGQGAGQTVPQPRQ